MADIRLLPAPVTLPPDPQVEAKSTSLVPASRLASSQALAQSAVAYPSDNYIWSVTAGDDGSFLFYAVPLTGSKNGGASAQSQDYGSASSAGFHWSTSDVANAAAQYSYYASLMTPVSGRLLDVYA